CPKRCWRTATLWWPSKRSTAPPTMWPFPAASCSTTACASNPSGADMQLHLPDLATPRLLIRRLRMDDLADIHRILDLEAPDGGSRDQRSAWLEWTVRNYDALELLYQPPYGERAVTLRESGELIGAVGLVPDLNFFAQIP